MHVPELNTCHLQDESMHMHIYKVGAYETLGIFLKKTLNLIENVI